METIVTETTWFAACRVEDVVENGGVCVKYENQQIALFYFTRRNEWYATQNECPHRKQMALSRGLLGSTDDDLKVACPFHKKTFSIRSEEHTSALKSLMRISYAVFCLTIKTK